MIVSHNQLIPAPLDRVAAVLCDEAYNVEVEQGREGVVSASFEQQQRDDEQVRFVLRSVEYARKKTGGLDRSKRENSSTSSCYRVADRVLTWEYRAANGDKRFVLRGTYRLSPEGEQTRMVHEVQVEVRIPLIGRQIAKFIAKSFEKDVPRYQTAMRRRLGG
jgi:hypothetical protein